MSDSCGPRPEYVDQDSVGPVLGVSRATYLAAARAGRFVSSKRMRKVFARRDDVERWIGLPRIPGAKDPIDIGRPDEHIAEAVARAGLRIVGAMTPRP